MQQPPLMANKKPIPAHAEVGEPIFGVAGIPVEHLPRRDEVTPDDDPDSHA